MTGTPSTIEILEALEIRLTAEITKLRNEFVLRNTTFQRIVNEKPDSITVGAPSQGQVKVYGDVANPTELHAKVEAAMKELAWAKAEMRKINGG